MLMCKGLICEADIRKPNGDEYEYEHTDLIVLWDGIDEAVRITVVGHGLELDLTQEQATILCQALEHVIDISGEAGV